MPHQHQLLHQLQQHRQILSQLNTNNVVVTISNAFPAPDGFAYGEGFTISSTRPVRWILSSYFDGATHAVGFSDRDQTGDVSPTVSARVRTVASRATKKGIYTGTVIVKYKNTTGSPWIDGPTVKYTITVTD